MLGILQQIKELSWHTLANAIKLEFFTQALCWEYYTLTLSSIIEKVLLGILQTLILSSIIEKVLKKVRIFFQILMRNNFRQTNVIPLQFFMLKLVLSASRSFHTLTSSLQEID